MTILKIENALDKTKNELKNWHQNTTDEKEKSYAVKHAEWTLEKTEKNKYIRDKRHDMVDRHRKYVYWTDLGMNVGSELNEPHFCVVIKEFEKVAVVIPLSSVKDGDESSQYKIEENGYFKIGKIKDLPRDKKDVYALISQVRTVSKKRLSSYPADPTQQSGGKKRYLTLKLSDYQMDIIDNAIKSQFLNDGGIL